MVPKFEQMLAVVSTRRTLPILLASRLGLQAHDGEKVGDLSIDIVYTRI